MIQAIQIASQGMMAAADRFGDAAGRIASFGAEPAGATASSPATRVDLSAEAVEIMTSKFAFEANVAVLRTSARMAKRLLDVLA